MIYYNKGERIQVDITCSEHGLLHISSEPLVEPVTVEGVMCPFCLFLCPVELKFVRTNDNGVESSEAD